MLTSRPLPPNATFTTEPILRLSVEQYHQMILAGSLTDEDPVEFVEGVLVYTMPQNSPHATADDLLRKEVEKRLPPGFYYRDQKPITLADGEPEPDGAIVRGSIRDYESRHPGPADVVIVFEVSDSTLARDRGMKLRSYARAMIPTFVLINLPERCVEVYSDPTSEGSEPSYRRREVLRETHEELRLVIGGQALAPIHLADLLPDNVSPTA